MPSPADDQPSLCGRTVLIAESNPLIALDLAETLRGWGAEPLCYNDLAESEKLAVPGKVAAALVDLAEFHPQQARLIDALQRNGVPIIGTTAWQSDIFGERYPDVTVLEKPVDYSALAQWFAALNEPASDQYRCCCG